MDLADDAHEASGFKGITVNGTIEAAYKTDDISRNNAFGASAGYADEAAMIQLTKQSQEEGGVDWTLRLLPGAASIVHEASVSIPVSAESRIIGGLVPDFQGYELSFPNANATLGNQLITHNALFEYLAPSSYAGIGMSHTFDAETYSLKWIVGNIDGGNDGAKLVYDANADGIVDDGDIELPNKSVGLAFRGDWFISEYAYVGFSGALANVNRNFKLFALDGGYTRGDWQFNGQVSFGSQDRVAQNGLEASWTGVSGLIGYKLTPRLQLLGRADFIDNKANGGGTYWTAGDSRVSGLGSELDSAGTAILDANGNNVGANLTRLTLGTNYQINSNTQWKMEYRRDLSTGSNFIDIDGNYKSTKTSIGTALVLSF
jgi:hypothetical protein